MALPRYAESARVFWRRSWRTDAPPALPDMTQAEAEARKSCRGVWAALTAIKNAERPGDILPLVGQFVVVEGKVLSVRTGRNDILCQFWPPVDRRLCRDYFKAHGCRVSKRPDLRRNRSKIDAFVFVDGWNCAEVRESTSSRWGRLNWLVNSGAEIPTMSAMSRIDVSGRCRDMNFRWVGRATVTTGSRRPERYQHRRSGRAFAAPVVLAAMLGLGGCGGDTTRFQTSPAVSARRNFPSPLFRRQRSEREHERILASYGGPYDDPKLEALITKTVDRLVAASERPDLVLQGDDPRTPAPSMPLRCRPASFTSLAA